MNHAFSLTFPKEVVMKTVFLTVLMLSLSSGPLLADKKTDERLANAAKSVRRNYVGAGQGDSRDRAQQGRMHRDRARYDERGIHRRRVVRAWCFQLPGQRQVGMGRAGDDRTRGRQRGLSNRCRGDRRRDVDHESRRGSTACSRASSRWGVRPRSPAGPLAERPLPKPTPP